MTSSPNPYPSPQDGSPTPGSSFEDLLLSSGLVSDEDLELATKEAKTIHQRLGYVLVRQGKLTAEQLGQILSRQHGLKYLPIGQIELDKYLLHLLPEEFIRENQVLPVAKEGGKLVVAMVDPTRPNLRDELIYLTGVRPMLVITTSVEFLEAYAKYYGSSAGGGAKQSVFLQELTDQTQVGFGSGEMSAEEEMRLQQSEEMNRQANPLVKLVNSIIDEGIDKGASDIHIEPRAKKMAVRYRVDGILRTVLDVPQNMEASFLTRLKVMSKMDIAEHRRPQDGRFAKLYEDTEYNFRVSTLPVGNGREKVVIRILRPAKSIKDFPELGFSEPEIEEVEKLYKAPHGLILVCGPTGSGKTTTLYTMLSKINEDSRNISTIEDPIELVIEGINQSQVNTKADYTFASSLRALLRQDPDVIMVGEIRDSDTLEAAIHASLTGHLVFSTIHSNTTAGVITRLAEMGASPSLVSASLGGVIAQRLVRVLCPLCKEPHEATEAEKRLLYPWNEERWQQDLVLYDKVGCGACHQAGYAGRNGLYEIMTIDRELRHMLSGGKSALEIGEAAVASGMKTLPVKGLEMLLSGQTTLEELMRVVGNQLGGE